MNHTPRSFGRREILSSAVALSASGCGYLLYPGRNGTRSGQVDVPILVIDLLWLIPGLIPGAICLIVDFTTGCIYRGGGKAERSTPAGHGPALASVHLDGEELARAQVTSGQASLDWTQSISEQLLRERGQLMVRRPDGKVATAQLGDLL